MARKKYENQLPTQSVILTYVKKRSLSKEAIEIYEVISIENDFYRIVDKSNEDYLYSKNFFEIVEETPTPLIIK